ncbi:MAG: hypothetical protein V9G19_20085 [Tetrasphaera sp.]
MTGPEATICPSCGTASWGSFCGRCGRPLVAAAATPPPPPAEPRGIGRAIGIGLICVLAAVTAGLGYRVLSRDNPTPAGTPGVAAGSESGTQTSRGNTATAPPATSAPPGETPSSPPTTSTTTVTVSSTASEGSADDSSAQRTANQSLREARVESLASLWLDGRWVLQLASKTNGMDDPLQTAENGSHTFYYTDIVAEQDRIKDRLAQRGWPSISLLASDFGTGQRVGYDRMWVLLGDPGGISSEAGAQSACQTLYPERSGELLKNVCVPRRLKPPSP